MKARLLHEFIEKRFGRDEKATYYTSKPLESGRGFSVKLECDHMHVPQLLKEARIGHDRSCYIACPEQIATSCSNVLGVLVVWWDFMVQAISEAERW
jgi:hypothetical protein